MAPQLIAMSIFLGAFVAIMGGVLVYERRRTRALEQAASDLGMRFEPKPGIVPGSSFELMRRGRSRRARNMISGSIEDLEAVLFDYSYRTGGGKNSSTHRQSVVLLHMTSAHVPKFILTPEGFFSKIGAAIGFDDIDFDDDPEFSKRFLLKSGRDDHEESIRAIFNTDLRAALLGAHAKVCVEAHGNDVIVYRRSRRMKGDEVSARLAEAFDIATLIWDSAAKAGH